MTRPSKTLRPKTSKLKSTARPAQTASYQHPEAKALIRPEAGAQSRFKKAKPKRTYRYDSSLAPELQWDGQSSAREAGEQQLAEIEEQLAQLARQREALAALAKSGKADAGELKTLAAAIEAALANARTATRELKVLGRPFLNWAGKAERLSFEVPSLPLFIHERLSTEAILATLKSHRSSGQSDFLRDYFGNPNRPLHEQITQSYEHENGWQNRLILGDSLVVMNSLIAYDKLAGRVQMIYMDPPYGVRFGSNFQPFVRKRDVANNDDAAMTREPEMVKAYRDTWEVGLHSYLSYLRDRLLLARELLTDSGSTFVQISDENLHHVREVMDEVFGAENCVAVIPFVKTAGLGASGIPVVCDYLIWYAKFAPSLKYHQLFLPRGVGDDGAAQYTWVQLTDGTRRKMTKEEQESPASLPTGSRAYRVDNLTSGAFRENTTIPFAFEGRVFHPGSDKCWKTTREGLEKLTGERRLQVLGNTLGYVRFIDDFPVQPLKALWTDTGTGGFGEEKYYVVQTTPKAIQRCILMTTDPGDLVLDPTCGSGTTAYVAEQWGRRWITTDTSRVPLALARQRLLTATFPYYELKQPSRGPAGGFVYQRKQNRNGEEIGGLVPHITLGSIANNEPPKMEVLVDRPEVKKGVTRLTGRFVVEATLPVAYGADGEVEDLGADADWTERMLAILRASPVLHLVGRTIRLARIRRPSQALVLSAEAYEVPPDSNVPEVDHVAQTQLRVEEPRNLGRIVALLFGPENGSLSERIVREAHDEASMKSRGYAHLYVVGFGIEPRAREYLEHADQLGVPATYVQATPDVLMGDLLKNLRSSQIFSVCGQPDVAVRKAGKPADAPDTGDAWYEAELRGLDVYDPIEQKVDSRKGDNVPAWLLDTNYNGMVFHVCQAFFPRTAAWDNIKRALKAEFDASVWDHLSGTTSTPFTAGDQNQIAVKVIDDRGNELLVVKKLGAV
ncbi:MAG: site-specific DNA-methyltransferase [Gammaproteobacteria bacterium]